MTLKEEWLAHAWRLAGIEADFYSGCRKILRSRTVKFSGLDNSLTLADAGYTKSKLTMLTKHYVHTESIAVAVELWNKRKEQAKYGSVSFTCFNHFVKGGSIDAKRSKRASVFGPCIQSVMITLVDKKTYSIDIGYRTTEFFKKFPADLVLLRDVLLKDFDFTGLKLDGITFYFANITLHPMYVLTPLVSEGDPIKVLDALKKKDKYFFEWAVKWSCRYLVPEYHRGIAKFAQAMRVHMDVNKRVSKKLVKPLISYLKKNHPGHRNAYVAPEGDEDE